MIPFYSDFFQFHIQVFRKFNRQAVIDRGDGRRRIRRDSKPSRSLWILLYHRLYAENLVAVIQILIIRIHRDFGLFGHIERIQVEVEIIEADDVAAQASILVDKLFEEKVI